MDGQEAAASFHKVHERLFLSGGHLFPLSPVAIHEDRIELLKGSGIESGSGIIEVGQVDAIIPELLLENAVARDGIVTGVVFGRSSKEEDLQTSGLLLWNNERSAESHRSQDEGEQEWNLFHEEEKREGFYFRCDGKTNQDSGTDTKT
jgi:hypothetical protein